MKKKYSKIIRATKIKIIITILPFRKDVEPSSYSYTAKNHKTLLTSINTESVQVGAWPSCKQAFQVMRVSKEKLQARKEHTQLPCAQAQSWLTTVMSCKSDTNQV